MACKDYSQFKLPPGTVPSGTNVVVIDGAGAHKILTNPASAGLLYFNGSTFSWATGAEGDRVKLPNLKVNDNTAVLAGFMGLGGDGGIQRVVNPTGQEMTLVSKNGILYWSAGIAGDIPAGNGFLVRNTGGVMSWRAQPGLMAVDSGGNPVSVPGLSAQNGAILQIVGGFPNWVDPNLGSIVTGATTADMSGVSVRRASNTTVVGTIPSYRLTNGSTDANALITIAGGEYTWNTATGLDAGTVANNTWYYGYIIADEFGASEAVLSLDPISPNLGGVYTHWGMVTIVRVDSSGNIVPYVQANRRFWIKPQSLGSGLQAGTGYAEIGLTTPLSQVIPPLTKSVSGLVGSANGTSANNPMRIAGSIDGVGEQSLSGWNELAGAFGGYYGAVSSFHDVPMLDPEDPKLFWMAKNFTIDRKLELTGYSL